MIEEEKYHYVVVSKKVMSAAQIGVLRQVFTNPYILRFTPAEMKEFWKFYNKTIREERGKEK